jgi:hypothetical protein
MTCGFASLSYHVLLEGAPTHPIGRRRPFGIERLLPRGGSCFLSFNSRTGLLQSTPFSFQHVRVICHGGGLLSLFGCRLFAYSRWHMFARSSRAQRGYALVYHIWSYNSYFNHIWSVTQTYACTTSKIQTIPCINVNKNEMWKFW